MIWNEHFVWLHFPKCAGTKTEEIFRNYYSDRSDIHQDVVDPVLDPSISWHDSLSQRIRTSADFRFDNQVVICNFRQLVPWLISRYNYEVTRSPHLPHDPEALLEGKFLENSGVPSSADDVALLYLPEEIVFSPAIRIVRNEYFKQDFISAFSPFIDTDIIPDVVFAEKSNASENHLPANIIDKLYWQYDQVLESCPHWRRIEKLFYST